VLSETVAEVFTVERLGPLAGKAAAILARVLHADGTKGRPERSPCQAIVIAAGGPRVPKLLGEQLRNGGRLLAREPIG
jgi:protein-L-isoaspartate O-methyltransferase